MTTPDRVRERGRAAKPRPRAGSKGGGWLRVSLLALLAGFLSFTVCASVGPLSDWTQRVGSCAGADRVERHESSGPTVRSRSGVAGYTDERTTVFTLACSYGDEVRLVANDTATLRGFAVAFLMGAVPATLLLLASPALARLRGARPPGARS